MLLSNGCEYGLRAALYLASLDHEGYVSIRDISEKLDISFPFLTKVFQKVTRAGLMKSLRGPHGGVALTRRPDEITLYEVVASIDGEDLFTECVMGLPGCGNRKPCPLHHRWSEERGRVERMFKGTTLADMTAKIQGMEVRLTDQAAGALFAPQNGQALKGAES